jgi:hypothetical protein
MERSIVPDDGEFYPGEIAPALVNNLFWDF